jgi:dUTP pyrophosphatase
MSRETDLNTGGSLQIKVKSLRSGAILPLRATNRSAGADLHCAEAFTLRPGERKLISTGLAVEIPTGFYGRIAPRSGLAVRHGIDTLAGIIDSDFRGEMKVALINLGDEDVGFEAGERIAQLIIERAEICDYVWADELSETERAEGGFGSTGKKERESG